MGLNTLIAETLIPYDTFENMSHEEGSVNWFSVYKQRELKWLRYVCWHLRNLPNLDNLKP